MHMNYVKLGTTLVLASLSSLLGGWDIFLRGLLILMGIDYVLGLTVAGVFNRSTKTPNGALSSYAGWVGLAKKISSLLLIIVANEIDLMLGSDFVRTSTIIFYGINEIISILEHAGTMGLPVPPAIVKAIDVLKGKESRLHTEYEKEG